MTDDHDDDRGRVLAAQAKLYNAALDSDVTVVATDWLCRAYLLTEIAGDNIEAAKDVIHTDAGGDAADREYKSMDDAAPNEFLTTIGLPSPSASRRPCSNCGTRAASSTSNLSHSTRTT